MRSHPWTNKRLRAAVMACSHPASWTDEQLMDNSKSCDGAKPNNVGCKDKKAHQRRAIGGGTRAQPLHQHLPACHCQKATCTRKDGQCTTQQWQHY
jgi:hypothetical protein